MAHSTQYKHTFQLWGWLKFYTKHSTNMLSNIETYSWSWSCKLISDNYYEYKLISCASMYTALSCWCWKKALYKCYLFINKLFLRILDFLTCRQQKLDGCYSNYCYCKHWIVHHLCCISCIQTSAEVLSRNSQMIRHCWLCCRCTLVCVSVRAVRACWKFVHVARTTKVPWGRENLVHIKVCN